MKAQDPHLSAADTQRLLNVAAGTAKAVLTDNPDSTGAEFERAFRDF
jgi:hypothetical protein